MYGISGKFGSGALTLLRNPLHPVSKTQRLLGLSRLLERGWKWQGVIPAAGLSFSILAWTDRNYLGNVRGVLFRITLTLKSSSTGAAYLDRRNIPGGPQRFGERLRSQPEYSREVRAPVWL
jgi:hypothetical protein